MGKRDMQYRDAINFLEKVNEGLYSEQAFNQNKMFRDALNLLVGRDVPFTYAFPRCSKMSVFDTLRAAALTPDNKEDGSSYYTNSDSVSPSDSVSSSGDSVASFDSMASDGRIVYCELDNTSGPLFLHSE